MQTGFGFSNVTRSGLTGLSKWRTRLFVEQPLLASHRMFTDFLRSRLLRSLRCSAVVVIVVQSLSAIAYAVPPSATGQPVRVAIPPPNSSTVVSVRQNGVITGSAPLTVVTADGVYVNGVLEPRLAAYSVPLACILIENTGFVPTGGETYELAVAVRNRDGSIGIGSPLRIPVINDPGSVIPTDCFDSALPPVAIQNPSSNRTIPDTNGLQGESVPFDGSLSTDADGTVDQYLWIASRPGGIVYATAEGRTVNLDLLDGNSIVQLVVVDNDGLPSTVDVAVTVNAAGPPPLQARIGGGNRLIADTNGIPGEIVILNGEGSFSGAFPINAYQWTEGATVLGSGQEIRPNLSDGVHVITLTVTDTQGATDTDQVVITVQGVAAVLSANAGVDRNITDTDRAPGETEVTLDGTQSASSNSTITSYQWSEGATALGSGATLLVNLSDGVHVITLTVTDALGGTATDQVTITVQPPAARLTANAGIDRTIADTDRQPGETVTLDGTLSSATNSTILSYEWSEDDTGLGEGATLQVALADGPHTITLTVYDNRDGIATDQVTITVGAAQQASLSALSNLTGKQFAMATHVDGLCTRVANTPVNQRTADQADLAARCDGLLTSNTAANQMKALDELNGADFSAARVQTMSFSNFLNTSVMDRLAAVRGGATGVNVTGLNLSIDGTALPLAELARLGQGMLGGGASADDPNESGLFGAKWSGWLRGNYSFGKGPQTSANPAFKSNQYSLLGGVDYRASNHFVLGGAFAYSDADLTLQPSNEGSLGTKSYSLSLYGAAYAAKSFYLDVVVNAANSAYAAERNIAYADGAGLVSADAQGNTDGLTLSGGFSFGYDIALGSFTVAPNIGAFYADATIDSFVESGAGGLNLAYDEQHYTSLTTNGGLRVTAAWKFDWGVLLPHMRADYIKELEDDVESFGVRFAADPNGGSSTPILIETRNVDTSYWRFAAGLSAQFKYGVAAYVDYQRLEKFSLMKVQDIGVGLRMQRSF